MPSATFWKLRRLAPRAKRVIARRGAENPVLSVFAITLPPKADAFTGAYDAAGKYGASWKRELAEGRGAIAMLLKTMQGWLPLVVRDVPGFSSSDYGDKPSIPDDVIEDAGRLRDLVSDARGADGNPLPYRDACLAALDEGLRVAEKEWSEADSAEKQYQALLEAVRQTGTAFDAEIIALRRHLAAEVGRKDRDYQKLRSERAAARDEEDDPNAPAGPGAVAPAAPGTNTPVA